jgi:hypothetical protein
VAVIAKRRRERRVTRDSFDLSMDMGDPREKKKDQGRKKDKSSDRMSRMERIWNRGFPSS